MRILANFSLTCMLLTTSVLLVSEAKSPKLNSVQKNLLKKVKALAEEAGHPDPSNIGKDPESCYSTKCLEASIQVLEGINFTADPCNSYGFDSYSCARRIHRTPAPPENHPLPYEKSAQIYQLNQNLTEQAIALIEEGISSSDPIGYKSAKIFYKQCLQSSKLTPGAQQALLNISNEYGGWPILHHGEVGENFNWWKLEAFQLNNDLPSTFFILNTDENGIHLSPGTYTPYTEHYSKEVKDFVNDITTTFNLVSAPSDVETAVKLMASNYKLLRKSLTEFGQTKPATIAELNEKFPMVNWEEFFSLAVKNKGIEVSPETVVYVHKKYLRQVLSVTKKLEPQVLANILHYDFLMAQTTGKNRPYTIITNMNGKESPQYCLEQAKHYFGPAMSIAYYKRYPLSNNRKETDKILDYVVAAYKNAIDNSSWISDGTKDHIKEKISRLYRFLGYPKWLDDKKKVKKFYSGLKMVDSETEYFQNIWNLVSWQTKMKKEDWEKDIDHAYYWDVDSYTARVDALYSYRNAVRVTASVMQSPIMDSEWPGFMNYGGVGMILSHELGHSLDTNGIMVNKDIEEVPGTYFDKGTLAAYNEWKEGILKSYGDEALFFDNAAFTRGNSESSIRDDIADIIGVKLGFEAYRNYIANERNGKDLKLPGLEHLSAEKLYFIKYSNMWCDDSPYDLALKMSTSSHSPNIVRAILPLKRSKHFADTFGCTNLNSIDF